MNLKKVPFLVFSTLLFSLLIGSATLFSALSSPSLTLLPTTNQLAQITATSVFCNSYGSGATPPSSFGAAYNIFSSARELILSAICNTTNTVSLTSGNGAITTYIWHQAYYTRDSQTWNPITLTGTQTTGGGLWIIGTAQSTQPMTTAEQQTQNYYASYVCTYQTNTWKCGCSDTTCATPKWNLQGIRKTTSSPPATGGTTTGSAGVFPGTNLKFYPGFIITGSGENSSIATLERRWQEMFDGNRKTTYRPNGVYGSIARRLNWERFYTDSNVRPANPSNPNDPGYDWSLLDATFEMNAVKNEGAMVYAEIRDVGYGGGSSNAPNWLVNAPYDGIFVTGNGGTIPKYYRFSGPDMQGRTNVGAQPPILDEWLTFHKALYDHLVQTGNINKVMGVNSGGEIFTGGSAFVPPPDYNQINLVTGVALRDSGMAKIWGASGIAIYAASLLDGTRKDIEWPYMQNPIIGMHFPDVKLGNTSSTGLTGSSRFSSPDGVHQKDIRPLQEATELNGYAGGNGINVAQTTFVAGVPNPWGYSNQTVPQTVSHVLWVFSGPPKGANKDSGLGQVGDDPAGPWPIHQIVLDWSSTDPRKPTVEQWHTAIDTFGPPGTFAFPYFPAGYNP